MTEFVQLRQLGSKMRQNHVELKLHLSHVIEELIIIEINSPRENVMNKPDDCTMDGDIFRVLRNSEQQYSLWPAALPVPDGWVAVGPISGKVECLAYVDAHWTDMRPSTLRQSMDDAARGITPNAFDAARHPDGHGTGH